MKPSPRRIVLLAADGVSVDRVIAESPAGQVIEELRRLRREYQGRSLAAEWQKEGKWMRWITTTE